MTYTKKPKITINERAFTMAQAKEVREAHRNLVESIDMDEIKRATHFYADDTHIEGIYSVTAEMQTNAGHLAKSSDDYDASIDCWIEMIVETWDKFLKIGFFYGDFTMLCEDNSRDVMFAAYIRKFEEVKA